MLKEISKYRCDNCDHGVKIELAETDRNPGVYPYVFSCKKQEGKWMPSGVDGGWTWNVGCASHSKLPSCIGNVLDITSPKAVEVLIRKDAKVLWVNTENGCVLRICQIPNLVVKDERENEYNVMDTIEKFISDAKMHVETISPYDKLKLHTEIEQVKALESLKRTIEKEMESHG